MWTKEPPKETGFYWFYGDPFWDQLPHDEEKGVNPYSPKSFIVEVHFVRDGFVTMVVEGTFMYNGYRGLFWSEKIIPPDYPQCAS